MASIYDWSSTADDNADSDADLTWAEQQNPNTVNNSARMMMKRVRDLLTDLAGGRAVTGTANGLVLTAASNFTTLANGRIVSFRAASTNTGAATLNVNGTGAKAIMTQVSGTGNALAAGQIIANGVYIVRYSTTANGGSGAWILQSPPSGPISVEMGGTGSPTATTARSNLGVGYYTGASNTELNLPIGQYVMGETGPFGAGNPTLNQTVRMSRITAENYACYGTGAPPAGTELAGTWKVRGKVALSGFVQIILAQRIA